MFGGKTYIRVTIAAVFLGCFFYSPVADALAWKPKQFRESMVVKSLNVRNAIRSKKGAVKVQDKLRVTGASLFQQRATFQKVARFMRNVRVDGTATFYGDTIFNGDVEFASGLDGAHVVLQSQDVASLDTSNMSAGTLFFDNASDELRLWDGDTWFDFAENSEINSSNSATYSAGNGLSLSGTTFSANLGDSITSAEIENGTIALADLSDNGCGTNELLKYNGSEWTCASDATGGSAALDDAYNNGQSITVDAADVDVNLNDATNDYHLVIDNTTAGAIDSAVSVLNSGGGTISTALDLSNASIGTAVDIGANDIVTDSTTIGSSELDRLDGKDAALVDTNDTPTWTGAHAWSLSGTENTSFASDLNGAVEVLSVVGTPSSTSATTRGIAVQQADSVNGNGFDSILFIDNADTDLVVTDALTITDSGGGGFTNLLNTPSIDITGSGAITGATGVTSSGTITLSNLTTCTALETNGSGVVSCGDDDDTTYTAGTGLTLSAGEFSVDLGDSIATGEITNGTILFEDVASNSCGSGEVMEYNGSAWTCGTDDTGASMLTGSNAFDAASIGDGECVEMGTVTVTGASTGDAVIAVPTPTTTGVEDLNITWMAFVSAANTVSIQGCSVDGNAINGDEDPASQTWSVTVLQ